MSTPPLTPEFAKGWTKGRESLRSRLLEVLEDPDHPIWISQDIQAEMIHLVKAGTK